MSIRKIKSISGIITNSSTQCFVYKGEAHELKSFFKKFGKVFIYLKNIEEVKNYLQGKSHVDHHYSRYFIYPLAKRELNLLNELIECTGKTFNECWEFLKESLEPKLSGGIIMYYNYRNNSKIINLLESNFPRYGYDSSQGEEPKYYWTTD